MKTFFHNGTAYPWSSEGPLFFRGYFLAGGVLYKGSSAIRYLNERLSVEHPGETLQKLDGVFSLILEREEEVLLAVDRLRGLPLFYALVDGELWAGDDAASLSPIGEADFFASKLFVSGEDTLLEELKQVPAASYYLFRKGEAKTSCQPYFQMLHQDFERDPAALESGLREAYHTTGLRLVQSLNGRTAVIPLSGGADSRMVLSMLRELNYEKVLCFTYGRKGSAESEISRHTAEYYGYPWVMVPYTRRLLREARGASWLEGYYQYAFAFCSVPHVQDLLAVKILHEGGRLPVDSVFVPGHSGDLIAGSHITPEFLRPSMSHEEFLDSVVRKFYHGKIPPDMRSRLEARFPPCPPQGMEEMASQIEWFNVQERQGKYIVNSVRVYEYFGYEWLIPLWDNALFAFWQRVPIQQRYQRRLYFKTVDGSGLPSTNDATAKKKIASGVRSVPGIRNLARRGARLLRYFRSDVCLEALVPFPEYLIACVREHPSFYVSDLICRNLLDKLRLNLRQNGNPSI